MATVTVTHSTVTGAVADPDALVDGPAWDDAHVVTGLENVDNTSDADKPVSTAQAATLAPKASPTFTGTVAINPASSSLGLGFNVTQTPHGTSTSNSSVAYNLLNVPSDDADTDGAAGGNSVLKITNNFGGSNMKGSRIALLTQSFLTAASSASNLDKEYVGIIGQVGALSADGGTNTGAGAAGSVFASNFYARAATGATNLVGVIGGEVNIEINTGGSAARKVGWQIVATANDAVQGATWDAALSVSSQGGAVGWNDGLLISNANGQFPIKSNGNVLRATAGTVANGIDLSALTVSSFAFKSLNFTVDGSGNISAPNVTATSGLVTPLIVGGGAASSSLTLESTNAAGTTDSIIFKTGSQVTRWTIDTNGILIGTAAIRPGTGTFSAGVAQIYTTAANGLNITGKAGSSFDLGIFAAAGQSLITNPTGTANVTIAGGSGTVGFGSGAFSANGSVATVLGSLGPVGSHTTVQKWFTINDGSTTYYIPAF